MAVTAVRTRTIQEVLDTGNLNEIANVIKQIKLGTILEPIKITFVGLTAATSFDITSLTNQAFATVNKGDISNGYVASKTPFPAISTVKTLRVTASGTGASVGSYQTSDAGGTATSPATSTVLGIALLSDDGKTLTFLTTVTAFVIEYLPRVAVDMNTAFAPNT